MRSRSGESAHLQGPSTVVKADFTARRRSKSPTEPRWILTEVPTSCQVHKRHTIRAPPCLNPPYGLGMQPHTPSRGALGRLELPEQLTRRNLLKAATVISAVSAVGLTACSSSSTPQATASLRFASPTLPKTVNNAEEAGQLVLQYAKYGASVGSYAIAGALIHNATGNVIRSGRFGTCSSRSRTGSINSWIRRSRRDRWSFPFDPTAHGERQLTYWYFENRKKLNLPDPQDITLVTSLDPRAMCTGQCLPPDSTLAFSRSTICWDQLQQH